MMRNGASTARTNSATGTPRNRFNCPPAGTSCVQPSTISAAMAGIARENVSRILNEWMRSKMVTRLSGYYCLENRDKLEREIKL